MNLQSIRWPVIALTAVLTLGLLFGGGYLVRNHTVDEPLVAILKADPAVMEHTVERQPDGLLITVKLTEVEELQQTYASLEREIKKVLKEAPFHLRVSDHKDESLEKAYRRINLYVHEAMATGKFTDMANRVEQEAGAIGAIARIGLDNDRVYVQLHYGAHYLYTVLERPQQVPPRSAEGGFGL